MSFEILIFIISISLLSIYYFPFQVFKIAIYIPYFVYKTLVLWKLRLDSSAMITHRGRIEYRGKGQNDNVLLYIHGSPGGYDQTTDPGKNYSVLTPSRPGYLGTDILSGSSPEAQADCFKALIDELKLDKVFVMGVSGGGPSAMHFAAQYPENTAGLILFEAVSYSEDFRGKDEALINAWDMDLFIQLSFMTFFGSKKLAARMLPNKNNRTRLLSSKRNVELLKKVIWSIWPISRRRHGIKNDYSQFMNLNIPFGRISCPTLIIHGSEDINVDINHAEYANKKINNSVLYVVHEGDHMMHATHEDEIEKQIELFIAEHS